MSAADRYDVFVGNLTFNTTEDQLREKFSFVGPVKNVRILQDKETGKPKGFAFVEYFDPNTALAAIRHLDQVEVNSRKLKVGYPAQSNLKEIARQIGQVVPESSADAGRQGGGGGAFGDTAAMSAANRAQIEQNVISSLKLHEAWDLLDAMKKLVAEDDNRGNKARAILETHPQLVSAMYEIHKRLGVALPKNVQQQQDVLAAAQQLIANASANALQSQPVPSAVPGLGAAVDVSLSAAPLNNSYGSRWERDERPQDYGGGWPAGVDYGNRHDPRDWDYGNGGWEGHQQQQQQQYLPPDSRGWDSRDRERDYYDAPAYGAPQQAPPAAHYGPGPGAGPGGAVPQFRLPPPHYSGPDPNAGAGGPPAFAPPAADPGPYGGYPPQHQHLAPPADPRALQQPPPLAAPERRSRFQ